MTYKKMVGLRWLCVALIFAFGSILVIGSGGGGGDDEQETVNVKPRDQINYETLGRVCSGQGVPEAGSYNENIPGPHPVIFSFSCGYMDPPQCGAGTENWWRSLPPDWYNDHKESVGNIELVACVSDDFDVIVGGPCQYISGPISIWPVMQDALSCGMQKQRRSSPRPSLKALTPAHVPSRRPLIRHGSMEAIINSAMWVTG